MLPFAGASLARRCCSAALSAFSRAASPSGSLRLTLRASTAPPAVSVLACGTVVSFGAAVFQHAGACERLTGPRLRLSFTLATAPPAVGCRLHAFGGALCVSAASRCRLWATLGVLSSGQRGVHLSVKLALRIGRAFGKGAFRETALRAPGASSMRPCRRHLAVRAPQRGPLCAGMVLF